MTISGNSTVGAVEPTLQAEKSSQTTKPQPSEGAGASDEVKLSPAAQAVALKHSGKSVSEIAAQLGTSVSIVSQYLGVSTKAEASLLAVASHS